MSPVSVTEQERLAALRSLEILDTEPEAEFDALVKAAAVLCGKPMSLISLVDEGRQWFKANVGLPGVSETPRNMAFCSQTIQGDSLLEVSDCTTDPRFADNPLVTGDPELRFYAGIPLRLNGGAQIGSLCVLDREPGTLSEAQRTGLAHLADAVVRAMEARKVIIERIATEARFRRMCDSLSTGLLALDQHGRLLYANEGLHRILGTSVEDDHETDILRHLRADDRVLFETHCEESLQSEQAFDLDIHVDQAGAEPLTVRLAATAVTSSSGEAIGIVGSFEDKTQERQHLIEQYRAVSMMRQTGALANVGGWELDLQKGTVVWTDQTCLIHALPVDYQPTLETALEFYTSESRDAVVTALDNMKNTAAARHAERESGTQAGPSDWLDTEYEIDTAFGAKPSPGFDMELRLQRADERIIWVRVVGEADVENGEVVRLKGAIQDIDQQVRQREALQNAHQRIMLATSSGRIGIFEWDLSSDKVVWTSQMLDLYGLPGVTRVFSIRQWQELLHPEDRAAAESRLQQALKEDDDYEDEFRIVQPDGHLRHLQTRAYIRRDEAGKAVKMIGVSWDVTRLRELADSLSEQHELLQVTLQSIDDAVITADREGHVTWLNPSAERLTGWECDDALGQPLNIVYRLHAESSGRVLESPVAECLATAQPTQRKQDMTLTALDGSHYGIEDSASPIMSRQGEPQGVVLVFRDVTEQRRMSNEMSYRAMHDDLTLVYNRTEFKSRLRRMLNEVQENKACHALMFIDLDQFKLVNDACGHTVGDQLLRQIAQLLMRDLREGDILARLGGDEFGILLKGCDAVSARNVAQEICRKVDEFRFVHDGRRFRIGASIGLVPVDDRWRRLESIMQAADSACYAAKEAGRNRVHMWFDTDQTLRARQGDMQWAARLQQSLEENRFELHAQRFQTLTGEGRGISAEILIRLRDDDGAVIMPTAFLSAAERFHLASRIDRWVLSKTIEFLRDSARDAGIDRLWVNLSGQSVGDKEFHRDAFQMLMQAGPRICEHLCLEITETTVVTNTNRAARFIERLGSLGVRTALDDFGAGASSFGYLKHLPVNALKIDGGFIRNLIDDPLDEAAVKCFVDVARISGLETVAEHIENEAVLERVRGLGVDLAQGFLIHEPQPLVTLLASSSSDREHSA